MCMWGLIPVFIGVHLEIFVSVCLGIDIGVCRERERERLMLYV